MKIYTNLNGEGFLLNEESEQNMQDEHEKFCNYVRLFLKIVKYEGLTSKIAKYEGTAK